MEDGKWVVEVFHKTNALDGTSGWNTRRSDSCNWGFHSPRLIKSSNTAATATQPQATPIPLGGASPQLPPQANEVVLTQDSVLGCTLVAQRIPDSLNNGTSSISLTNSFNYHTAIDTLIVDLRIQSEASLVSPGYMKLGQLNENSLTDKIVLLYSTKRSLRQVTSKEPQIGNQLDICDNAVWKSALVVEKDFVTLTCLPAGLPNLPHNYVKILIKHKHVYSNHRTKTMDVVQEANYYLPMRSHFGNMGGSVKAGTNNPQEELDFTLPDQATNSMFFSRLIRVIRGEAPWDADAQTLAWDTTIKTSLAYAMQHWQEDTESFLFLFVCLTTKPISQLYYGDGGGGFGNNYAHQPLYFRNGNENLNNRSVQEVKGMPSYHTRSSKSFVFGERSKIDIQQLTTEYLQTLEPKFPILLLSTSQTSVVPSALASVTSSLNNNHKNKLVKTQSLLCKEKRWELAEALHSSTLASSWQWPTQEEIWQHYNVTLSGITDVEFKDSTLFTVAQSFLEIASRMLGLVPAKAENATVWAWQLRLCQTNQLVKRCDAFEHLHQLAIWNDAEEKNIKTPDVLPKWKAWIVTSWSNIWKCVFDPSFLHEKALEAAVPLLLYGHKHQLWSAEQAQMLATIKDPLYEASIKKLRLEAQRASSKDLNPLAIFQWLEKNPASTLEHHRKVAEPQAKMLQEIVRRLGMACFNPDLLLLDEIASSTTLLNTMMKYSRNPRTLWNYMWNIIVATVKGLETEDKEKEKEKEKEKDQKLLLASSILIVTMPILSVASLLHPEATGPSLTTTEEADNIQLVYPRALMDDAQGKLFVSTFPKLVLEMVPIVETSKKWLKDFATDFFYLLQRLLLEIGRDHPLTPIYKLWKPTFAKLNLVSQLHDLMIYSIQRPDDSEFVKEMNIKEMDIKEMNPLIGAQLPLATPLLTAEQWRGLWMLHIKTWYPFGIDQACEDTPPHWKDSITKRMERQWGNGRKDVAVGKANTDIKSGNFSKDNMEDDVAVAVAVVGKGQNNDTILSTIWPEFSHIWSFLIDSRYKLWGYPVLARLFGVPAQCSLPIRLVLVQEMVQRLQPADTVTRLSLLEIVLAVWMTELASPGAFALTERQERWAILATSAHVLMTTIQVHWSTNGMLDPTIQKWLFTNLMEPRQWIDTILSGQTRIVFANEEHKASNGRLMLRLLARYALSTIAIPPNLELVETGEPTIKVATLLNNLFFAKNAAILHRLEDQKCDKVWWIQQLDVHQLPHAMLRHLTQSMLDPSYDMEQYLLLDVGMVTALSLAPEMTKQRWPWTEWKVFLQTLLKCMQESQKDIAWTVHLAMQLLQRVLVLSKSELLSKVEASPAPAATIATTAPGATTTTSATTATIITNTKSHDPSSEWLFLFLQSIVMTPSSKLNPSSGYPVLRRLMEPSLWSFLFESAALTTQFGSTIQNLWWTLMQQSVWNNPSVYMLMDSYCSRCHEPAVQYAIAGILPLLQKEWSDKTQSAIASTTDYTRYFRNLRYLSIPILRMCEDTTMTLFLRQPWLQWAEDILNLWEQMIPHASALNEKIFAQWIPTTEWVINMAQCLGASTLNRHLSRLLTIIHELGATSYLKMVDGLATHVKVDTKSNTLTFAPNVRPKSESVPSIHTRSSTLPHTQQETLDKHQWELEMIQERKGRQYHGIVNPSIFCYIISATQQFFMTTNFRRHILQLTQESNDEFLVEMGKVFRRLSIKEKFEQAASINSFLLTLRDAANKPLNWSEQNDSQEYVQLLLDRLVMLSSGHPHHVKTLQSLFAISTTREKKHLKCQHTVIQSCPATWTFSLRVRGHTSLLSSLRAATSTTSLTELMECPTCLQKSKVEITDKLDATTLPETIVFHVCRFQSTEHNVSVMEKLVTPFAFPFDTCLDLEPFCYGPPGGSPSSVGKLNNTKYELGGIVVHDGSLRGGHYFSYIKTPSGEWWELNDRNAFALSEDLVRGIPFKTLNTSYMLWYRRCSVPVRPEGPVTTVTTTTSVTAIASATAMEVSVSPTCKPPPALASEAMPTKPDEGLVKPKNLSNTSSNFHQQNQAARLLQTDWVYAVESLPYFFIRLWTFISKGIGMNNVTNVAELRSQLWRGMWQFFFRRLLSFGGSSTINAGFYQQFWDFCGPLCMECSSDDTVWLFQNLVKLGWYSKLMYKAYDWKEIILEPFQTALHIPIRRWRQNTQVTLAYTYFVQWLLRQPTGLWQLPPMIHWVQWIQLYQECCPPTADPIVPVMTFWDHLLWNDFFYQSEHKKSSTKPMALLKFVFNSHGHPPLQDDPGVETLFANLPDLIVVTAKNNTGNPSMTLVDQQQQKKKQEEQRQEWWASHLAVANVEMSRYGTPTPLCLNQLGNADLLIQHLLTLVSNVSIRPNLVNLIRWLPHDIWSKHLWTKPVYVESEFVTTDTWEFLFITLLQIRDVRTAWRRLMVWHAFVDYWQANSKLWCNLYHSLQSFVHVFDALDFKQEPDSTQQSGPASWGAMTRRALRFLALIEHVTPAGLNARDSSYSHGGVVREHSWAFCRTYVAFARQYEQNPRFSWSMKETKQHLERIVKLFPNLDDAS